MYKIDKSTWDQMSSNKDRIIKQWVPQPHESSETIKTSNLNQNTPSTSANEEIVVDSEKQKDEIIKTALLEAEKIKKNAYDEGYDDGINKAKKKLDDVYKMQSAQLAAILGEIDDSNNRLNKEMEDKSLVLALHIAEKILNMKIENDDKVFVGLVKSALAMMEEDEKFILRLNTREYDRYFKDKHESFVEALECDVPISVLKDKSLNEGGLIIESETSFIDASVDTQLSKISNSLTKRDAKYHEAL